MASDETEKMARMHQWLAQVSAALDVDPAVVEAGVPALLDLVRDVAHGPSRPGAPLTAFVVGLALARQVDEQAGPAEHEATLRRVIARLDEPLQPYRGG